MVWFLARRLAVDSSGMKRLAVFALLAAACTSNSATTTTIDPLPPPPNPDGSTTTTEPAPPPETGLIEYEGAFPDGNTFGVFIEGIPREEVTSISGVVMFESSDGPVPAAETIITLTNIAGNSYNDGVYRAQGGGVGGFVLNFYDEVLEELGPDASKTIHRSIRGSNLLSIPLLSLTLPLRWATPDDQLTVPMEVAYETFVVRKGCDEIAVACSPSRGAQVIPMDRVVSPARSFDGEYVFIESTAPRPVMDRNYLDPGPLRVRDSGDVVWTGQEMVVWGGEFGGINYWPDGAAFNPETNTWRMIEGPIGSGLEFVPGLSRAVWYRDQMLIVTPTITYLGDPLTGQWAEFGGGFRILPRQPIVAIDDAVYAWTDVGIVQMDRDGNWEELPDPGFGDSDQMSGNLVDFGGNLVAIGVTCNLKEFAIWAGSDWTELEPVRFRDCSAATQTAAFDDELMVWSTNRDPTYVFNAGDLTWEPLASIPAAMTEGPSGPVPIGDRMLVPSWTSSAIYDARSRSWVEIELPGLASSDQMVWTGTEILAWTGKGPYGDAWRWTPPE